MKLPEIFSFPHRSHLAAELFDSESTLSLRMKAVSCLETSGINNPEHLFSLSL